MKQYTISQPAKVAVLIAFFALALVTAVLMTACNGVTPREVKTLTLTSEEQVINRQQNEFTLNLLKQVNANEEGENVFLSPLSVAIVCGMTANGAEGNTLGQILKTIGAEGYSVDDLNEYYKNILTNIPYLDAKTDINIADAIWLDDGCKAKDAFVQANKTYYFAAVENTNLQDPAIVKIINSWAERNTKGLIKEVVKESDFNELTRMVIANAIYFKGKWEEEFKAGDTQTEDFTLADGKTTSVRMMNQHEEFYVMPDGRYEWNSATYEMVKVEDYTARMLRMYFKDKAYCMDIVLPRAGISCDNYLARLDMDELNRLQGLMEHADVEVRLPKFSLKYHRSLNDDMKALGMTDIFDDKLADLSGITAEEQLFLSRLFQDAFIEVDEEGAKAAAVTVAIDEAMSAEPVEMAPFIVNRPFLLFIREAKYGTILFAGKIGHPATE